MRKGILLAGGKGTRLYPATRAVGKQLLPVYDKPMVYYSLSTLMLAGVREVLLICTPSDQPLYDQLLGDGRQWGLKLSYAVQAEPEGIAQALLIGEEFLNGEPCVLALGDNIFFGSGLIRLLRASAGQQAGATVFAYWVKDPQRYGVVTLDQAGRPTALVEKPCDPISNYAVTGIYFYDGNAPAYVRALRPSGRGELEITDLNRIYLERGELAVKVFGRGIAWLDTGTPESLLQVAHFIQVVEERQGLKVGCPEEIAYRQGWISATQLLGLAQEYRGNLYGEYLTHIAQEDHIGGPLTELR
jgi:glucose-1-phosphate thymidylyltransferase